MEVDGKHYRTVWMDGNTVRMVNQPLLPHRFEIVDCADYRATARAIRQMTTRGAGALGVAAGYAMAQAVSAAPAEGRARSAFLEEARRHILDTRPTAQNLFYCVGRVWEAALDDSGDPAEMARREAELLADEDIAAARSIGEAGAVLLHDGMRVLTHCNAGWLAFADWGTALAPIYRAHRKGVKLFVWVDETRPRLQGARLTAWELAHEGVNHAVIADNAAGYYMARGEVDLVIVGADRIARNGDVANKIGTYEKAVVARENGIPFYVAAPLSTVDWECAAGDGIPIEERGAEEVREVPGVDSSGRIGRVRITAAGSPVRNPAFDVTPAAYITGIITEKGLVEPGKLVSLAPAR